MNGFTSWLKSCYITLLSWFGVEAQKIASFLYPIFQDAEKIVKSDIMGDLIDLIPAVATAMTGAGGLTVEAVEVGLTAAKELLLPLLEKQGVELASETINTLANGLVAQAKIAIATPAQTAGLTGAGAGDGSSTDAATSRASGA